MVLVLETYVLCKAGYINADHIRKTISFILYIVKVNIINPIIQIFGAVVTY